MIVYSHFIEEKPLSRSGKPTMAMQNRVMIDEHGREVLDKTPVEIPVNLGTPPSSLMDFIHALYKQRSEQEEMESFEDSNNFDIPDETGIEMMDTPYEMDFDHIEQNSGAPQPSSGTPEPDKPDNPPVQE